MWEPTKAEGSLTQFPQNGWRIHARRVGDLLYLSGVDRQPGTNEIPGGPIHDKQGNTNYDIKAQTQAVVDNITRIRRS